MARCRSFIYLLTPKEKLLRHLHITSADVLLEPTMSYYDELANTISGKRVKPNN